MIFIHTLIIYDKIYCSTSLKTFQNISYIFFLYMTDKNRLNVIKEHSSHVVIILNMKSLIIEEEKYQITD